MSSTVEERGGVEGLRVGYVNSRGFNKQNWTTCQRWIEAEALDLLFVAETWYVGWEEYSTWRHTIAVSPRPEVSNGSRNTGGLCLLGTPVARGVLVGEVEVRESMITVQLGQWRISGVYIPPSMHPGAVEALLQQASASDVLLGDINVRFGDKGGEGAPKERARVVMNWAQVAGLFHLQPSAKVCPWPKAHLSPRLTVDHCFARHSRAAKMLHLLQNARLGLRTDHQYTMLLSLGNDEIGGGSATCLPRFGIYKLARRKTQRDLQECWAAIVPDCQGFLDAWGGNVDQFDERLVALCQRVCERVLGRAPRRQPTQCRVVDGARNPANDPTPAGTHRLVRRALTDDHSNTALLPLQPGKDALEEVVEQLEARYMRPVKKKAGEACDADDGPGHDTVELVTKDEVVAEIAKQSASKACGSDGIHMRVLKALRTTSFIRLLTCLYNACLAQSTTPRAWNSTDVHLIVKDQSQPKTASNVRPITLIGMFRKVFECLLLKRFDGEREGWARVHPMQAGFRRSYSTLTHAALLHILIERRRVETVVFLDFRSAFDVVDHDLLLDILWRRGCPTYIRGLIRSLMVEDVRSRVFGNGCASRWFPRTCGVLQGSPLSPALFNLFVDGLLRELNAQDSAAPYALFYADDGVLLAPRGFQVQVLVDVVRRWTQEFKMALNVKKCGLLTRASGLPPVWWGDEQIAPVFEYKYLGFPVTANGIDFESYIERRIGAAVRRAEFVSIHAHSWRQAHRLRFYRQYLAPIFEYGAPLLWTWSRMDRLTTQRWDRATERWKDLVHWVAGNHCSWHLTANLLGLPMLEQRFELLHAAYVLRLEEAREDDPLRRALSLSYPKKTYARGLKSSALFVQWKSTHTNPSNPRESLSGFLLQQQSQMISQAAEQKHLTRIIPFCTRLRRRYRFADATLEAPLALQDTLFRYRQGRWQIRQRHKCKYVDRTFHRGDEECRCWGVPPQLSQEDQRRKKRAEKEIPSGFLFTDVDFLLNNGQFERAAKQLQRVQIQLLKDNRVVDTK